MRSLVAAGLLFAVACTPRCGCGDDGDERDFGDAVIADGTWRAMVDNRGVIRLRFNHTDVLTSALMIGGREGRPPQVVPGSTTVEGGVVSFSAEALALGMRLQGRATPTEGPDGAVLEVVYSFDVASDLDDLVGGGIEMVLRRDPRVFGRRASAPELLSGDTGFAWDTGRGIVRCEFEPALADVAWDAERSVVRMSFYDDEVKAGTREIKLRIVLPSGGVVEPAPFATYAAPDAKWNADTLPYDDVPVDLSFLNADDRPAGKHGPIRIEGERYLRGDGQPLRLWGTNVTGNSLFDPSDAGIEAQAKRIAAFGFNVVRLHHHDSWFTQRTVFGSKDAPNTTDLDDASLERLDRWVTALQAEGVYVWIDLNVGRSFTPADGIDAYPELINRRVEGASYINASVATRMKEFATAYLGRTNRYTGLRYAEDPGVVGVLVTNENDMVEHYGRQMVKGAGRPRHHEWFEAKLEEIADRRGLDLPWRFDPNRPGGMKEAISALEAEFFLDAIANLRQLGYQGPVAPTQYWGGPVWTLPSLTAGDVMDVHAYAEEGLLRRNPHVDHNTVSAIATGAVAGMPTMVGEWNIPPPAADRFVGATLVAAAGALQSWDAMLLYAYTSIPIAPPRRPEVWSSLFDPAAMVMMPAAALMFRRGDVAPAREHYALTLDRAAVFERALDPQRLATVRSVAERSELRIVLPQIAELDWMKGTTVPEGATVLVDPDVDALEPAATRVESDTGEIVHDWALGTHTVTTARNVSATGEIGNRTFVLDAVTIEIATPRAAAIAVSSLDGLPLAESADILVATVAQVTPRDMQLPLLSEPIHGRIALRSNHVRLRWQPLGARAGAVPSHISTLAEGHQIALSGEAVHFWRVSPDRSTASPDAATTDATP